MVPYGQASHSGDWRELGEKYRCFSGWSLCADACLRQTQAYRIVRMESKNVFEHAAFGGLPTKCFPYVRKKLTIPPGEEAQIESQSFFFR